MPIAFDPAGLQQYDQSTWFSPANGDQVSVHYFDQVPDLPAGLDELPKLRHDLAVLTAESGCLLEAHVVSLGAVPALLQILKLPLPDQPTGQVFIAAFTVPKAHGSAVLRVQCAESGMTGMREATLMAQLGHQNWVYPHPYAPELTGRLPYHAGDDPRWDGQFPDHPLSRVRAWAHHVVRTAWLDPNFAALPPFQPRVAPPQTAQQQPAPPPEPAQQRPTQQQPTEQQQPTQQQPTEQQPARGPAQASGQPAAQPAQQDAQAPATRAGSQLVSAIPGIPIGEYLPLWLGDQQVSYWRMPDPPSVLAKLGKGVLSRSAVADEWLRDSVLLNVDDSALLMSDRYRDERGNITGEEVGLIPATEQEAHDAVTQESLSAAASWLGDVAVAAAGRDEPVVVGPGGWTQYGRPRVMLMVVGDKSVVTASPAPVGAPVWKDGIPADYQPGETDEFPMTGPVSTETIHVGGQLAMLAVGTWDCHPLHLCVSFRKTS